MFRLILYATFILGALSGQTKYPSHGEGAAKAIAARQQLENCTPYCKVEVEPVYTFTWYPMEFSTTVVAATVIEIVNTLVGTTRTSTISNDLPSGYTPPATNDDGTQVTTVTYSQQGTTKTTVLAFPTSFTSWADGYTWQGRLQTEKDDETACVTAIIPSFVPFESFPQPTSISMPTHPSGPDPKGLLFKPTSIDLGAGAYVEAFPDEGALQTCSLKHYPLPLAVEPTARFLSKTITYFEGGKAVRQAESSSHPATPSSAASKALSHYWTILFPCLISALGIILM
ncbi:hypothetical protein CPC735_025470 [Coccidioides posadasii C735 delta SOWgp]|uniref:Uncharacterized protein n=2 Tax=Coccidioides posadasii TaxID=199306 RepID=A0A0J6F9S4_COCPO|nr:hypothetical protein CPC735_025470 [Coccidioides posadasii C735 delta SOWgp]EER27211.1 hypothetical protein CPC735_025470 [Coccidioides posadasii C735 delta SOWgp]KMM66958.1 hypothetical protein CPAG_03294 [Coccidioides posadasii RMSCC 3488]|eukprot:XP_003069356.1 hypothetical protein CPC735_025470 [Coccidioides posadasii C735 delta SOWgp]